MEFDQLVLLLDEFTRDILAALVLDELEHVRKRGQGEHPHHQAFDAGGGDELIVRVAQMVEQISVEQRLALLLQAEHRVELRFRLGRYQ